MQWKKEVYEQHKTCYVIFDSDGSDVCSRHPSTATNNETVEYIWNLAQCVARKFSKKIASPNNEQGNVYQYSLYIYWF